jgi:Mg-chelatase subunit ChlD
MRTMQKAKVIHKQVMILFAVVAIILVNVQARCATPETEAVKRVEPPEVEVVFVLDTTGSMGGLIAAAKEKIWSIANTLASTEVTPMIKMGLVGYRDRGDEYITTSSPLSDDLDSVYTDLMEFSADGGGDTPESVNQALYEAVTNFQWSKDKKAYRVIFLVGDSPPKMNYPDDVKYQKTCNLARELDIVINAIQCGNMVETQKIWQEIASLGGGEYFRVDQSGGAVLYETPYDEKIASLSAKLDATRIYYGKPEERMEMEERKKEADKIYSEAAPSAVAKRTIFNTKESGKKNFLGSQELVDDVDSGKVLIGQLDEKELPTKLQGKKKEEVVKIVAELSEERKHLQAEISDLASQRQEYIKTKVAEEKDKGASSLDSKIYKSIQTQAARKNIKYEGGPEY